MVKVIDFDGTVFKRNHGLIEPVVEYLDHSSVYILTFRAHDQLDFILDTLRPTNINIVGVGFADSRAKDPVRKMELMRRILSKYEVEVAIDDDAGVRQVFESMGVKCVSPDEVCSHG